jgi:hypothetical protein
MVAVTEPIKSILKIAVSVLRKTDSASSYKTQHALLQSPSSRGVKKISQTFCRIEITKIKIIFLLLEFVRKKIQPVIFLKNVNRRGRSLYLFFRRFNFPRLSLQISPTHPRHRRRNSNPVSFTGKQVESLSDDQSTIPRQTSA